MKLIEEQEKALFPKLFNDDGKQIEDKLRQLSNASYSMVLRQEFDANVIDLRPLLAKVEVLISSTFAGIAIEVKFEQMRNACSPISFTEGGFSIEIRLEQPRNASEPIL